MVFHTSFFCNSFPLARPPLIEMLSQFKRKHRAEGASDRESLRTLQQRVDLGVGGPDVPVLDHEDALMEAMAEQVQTQFNHAEDVEAVRATEVAETNVQGEAQTQATTQVEAVHAARTNKDGKRRAGTGVADDAEIAVSLGFSSEDEYLWLSQVELRSSKHL